MTAVVPSRFLRVPTMTVIVETALSILSNIIDWFRRTSKLEIFLYLFAVLWIFAYFDSSLRPHYGYNDDLTPEDAGYCAAGRGSHC